MKSFNSKILLFGEYCLLHGSMGLAIPYPKYSGKLLLPRKNATLSPKEQESNSVIKSLAAYISSHIKLASQDQISGLLRDSQHGLYFDSNIPNSYGIGSSGTLVAAIYNQYFYSVQLMDKGDGFQLKNLKHELSQIESFFHGKSSGTDPLVAYLNNCVLLNAPENNYEFRIPENISIFLIDTGKSSSTKGFMKIFDDSQNNKPDLLKTFTRKNNDCIMSFLENRNDAFDIIKDFGIFEQQFLEKMFYCPAKVSDLFNRHKDNLAIKLSGSGGGGFLLGFAQKNAFKAIMDDFINNNIPIEPVEINQSNLINI